MSDTFSHLSNKHSTSGAPSIEGIHRSGKVEQPEKASRNAAIVESTSAPTTIPRPQQRSAPPPSRPQTFRNPVPHNSTSRLDRVLGRVERVRHERRSKSYQQRLADAHRLDSSSSLIAQARAGLEDYRKTRATSSKDADHDGAQPHTIIVASAQRTDGSPLFVLGSVEDPFGPPLSQVRSATDQQEEKKDTEGPHNSSTSR